MDPISIASGIVSLAFSAGKLALVIDQLIEDYRSVDEDMSSLSLELHNLLTVLNRLKAYSSGPGLDAVLPAELIADIGPVIKSTKMIFTRLEDLFHKLQKGGLAPWNKFRWVYNQKDVVKLKNDLAAHKLTLNMTLTMVTCLGTHKVQQSTARIERNGQEMLHLLQQMLNQDRTQFSRLFHGDDEAEDGGMRHFHKSMSTYTESIIDPDSPRGSFDINLDPLEEEPSDVHTPPSSTTSSSGTSSRGFFGGKRTLKKKPTKTAKEEKEEAARVQALRDFLGHDGKGGSTPTSPTNNNNNNKNNRNARAGGESFGGWGGIPGHYDASPYPEIHIDPPFSRPKMNHAKTSPNEFANADHQPPPNTGQARRATSTGVPGADAPLKGAEGKLSGYTTSSRKAPSLGTSTGRNWTSSSSGKHPSSHYDPITGLFTPWFDDGDDANRPPLPPRPTTPPPPPPYERFCDDGFLSDSMERDRGLGGGLGKGGLGGHGRSKSAVNLKQFWGSNVHVAATEEWGWTSPTLEVYQSYDVAIGG